MSRARERFLEIGPWVCVTGIVAWGHELPLWFPLTMAVGQTVLWVAEVRGRRRSA